MTVHQPKIFIEIVRVVSTDGVQSQIFLDPVTIDFDAWPSV